MKKNKGLFAACLAGVMLTLCACGENVIPALTEEQIEEIGEYTAFTLMEYDASHRSRLVDISKLTATPSPIEEEPGESKEEESGMRPTEETPVEDLTEGGSIEATEEREEDTYTAADILGLPESVTFSFVSYEIADRYPLDEGTSFVVLPTSGSGNSLLALHFQLTNVGEEDADLNFYGNGSVFQLTVNEEYTRRAMQTMLLDDLSSYSGTVGAGESKDLVLLLELNEERTANLTSCSLHLKNESKSCTIQLF